MQVNAGFCVAVTVLMAGCAATPPTARVLDEAASHADPAAHSLYATDCRGLASEFTWPTGGPGPAPSGWDKPAGEPTSVDIVAESCARVNVGPFERPLTYLVEGHTRFVAPPQCDKGRPGAMFVVASVWVSDPEVGAWLRDAWGLPVVNGTLDADASTATGALSQTFHWSALGGRESSVATTGLAAGPPGSGRGTFPVRFAWATGPGITLADWTHRYDDTRPDWPIQTGHLEPPMLYAGTGPDPYVGHGFMFRADDVVADMVQYEDNACMVRA